ncbi:MAG: TPM domain-containing protein [Eubacteriales bacterium]|nr:TPM domain-containing protein [Eubacteriales bacterium]
MKRLFSSIFLAVLVLMALAPAARAAEAPLVVDNGALLTAREESALAEKAASLREAYGMDLVIVTAASLNGKTPEAYADDYYDENGYQDDGILFLLSMEERDWYISTCGSGIYALTDYGIQQLGETILPDLADGRYYEAFDRYLDTLASYLDAFRAGTPIDGEADLSGDFYTGTREETVHSVRRSSPGRVLLTSLPIGLIAALVTVLSMRYTMNTKRRQTAAAAYMKDGSFHLRRCQDLFLYSNVSKTRRQESSGSSGGSSVHRSSSGRSHGGGGGKF